MIKHKGRKKRKLASESDVDETGIVEAEVLIQTEEISLNATNDGNIEESIDIDSAAALDPLEEDSETFKQEEDLTEDPIYFDEFNEDDFLEECVPPIVLKTEIEAGKRKKRKRNAVQDAKLAITGTNGFRWSTDITEELSSIAAPSVLKPAGKGPARQVSNPLEAWQLLLDEHILMPILKYTNEEVRRRKGKNRPLDPIELRAWLGLNYLLGIFHNSPNCASLEDLWSVELGNAVFRSAMTATRFQQIFDFIRFSSAAQENAFDCVFNLWLKFLINCRSYYMPSGNCIIDEYILKTNDTQCPLICALPGNDAVQGLRVVTMCDAKTQYICNAVVAEREVTEEPEVLTLVQDIKGTNRTISLPERYTTMSLVDKLEQRNLTCVGALPTSAPEIPTEFQSCKNACNLYAGKKLLMTGFSPVENPTGFLLTCTMPQSINARKLYGRSRRIGQQLYESIGKYSTTFAMPANKQRWTLNSFHAILDFAVFNAWVIYQLSEANNPKLTQRDFQRQLGLYLTQQQLLRRADRNLPLLLKVQVAEMLGQSTTKLLGLANKKATQAMSEGLVARANQFVPKDVVLSSKYFVKRKRCRVCRGANAGKTRIHCQQCMTPLCMKHLIQRCSDCLGVEVMPPENPSDLLKAQADVVNEAIESGEEHGGDIEGDDAVENDTVQMLDESFEVKWEHGEQDNDVECLVNEGEPVLELN